MIVVKTVSAEWYPCSGNTIASHAEGRGFKPCLIQVTDHQAVNRLVIRTPILLDSQAQNRNYYSIII